MNTTDVIGIVIAVVVVAAFAFVAWRGMQRRRLRDRFGDEYERVVAAKGRPGADSELRDRERRHARLDLHDLTDAQRAHYRDGWLAVQERFVDDPVAAVRDGDRLVNELVSDRGYPASDYEDRLAHLSVEHANVLNHYRDAHEISVRNEAGTATTEQLRQSLVHYRELFTALLGEQPARRSASTADAGTTAPATISPATTPPATNGAPAANGAQAAHAASSDATVDRPPVDGVSAGHDSADEEPADGEPAGEGADRSDVDSVAAGTRGSASRFDASAPSPDSATPDTPPHTR